MTGFEAGERDDEHPKGVAADPPQSDWGGVEDRTEARSAHGPFIASSIDCRWCATELTARTGFTFHLVGFAYRSIIDFPPVSNTQLLRSASSSCDHFVSGSGPSPRPTTVPLSMFPAIEITEHFPLNRPDAEVAESGSMST